MKETLEELATLYVLDQLGRDERAEFEARLRHGPELAALVRDLESGLALGIRSLPSHEPSADLLTRIEKQIDAPRPSVAVAKPVDAAFSWTAFARWGLAAMIAISLSVLAVQSLRSPAARPAIVFVGLDVNRNTFAELPVQESSRDADARFIQLASLAENFWSKPNTLPVKPDSAAGDNRGYAVFDPGSRQGFIAIEHLPLIDGNQRYHLWIIDPSTTRVRDAGILPLAGMNRGLYSFMLEPTDGPKSSHPNFFITVEENSTAPQEPQPRGKVVLGHQRI